MTRSNSEPLEKSTRRFGGDKSQARAPNGAPVGAYGRQLLLYWHLVSGFLGHASAVVKKTPSESRRREANSAPVNVEHVLNKLFELIIGC